MPRRLRVTFFSVSTEFYPMPEHPLRFFFLTEVFVAQEVAPGGNVDLRDWVGAFYENHLFSWQVNN